MNTKQRTKLDLIRIEGICRMLLHKIEEEQLNNLVESVTKASSKDIRKTIFKLPRYQLIQIIELAGKAITSADIDATYEQYRYGLKPGFTLFSINKKYKNISESAAYKVLSDSLSEIPYGEDENIKSISAKAHTKIGASVIEFSFSYLNKHSYLTENEEPAFVYELEECFAWIDPTNGFLAIKNAPEKVLAILKKAFSTAYSTQILNIKLTKKLIRDIFGDEKIKKGSFIKPNASDNEAEKITVSDSRFSEKQAIQNSVSGYDMTGTFLNETVGKGESNTLGINCEKGRLYLTSNVSATVFREWSVERITSIIQYLSEGADYLDYEIFRAKNVMSSTIWTGYSLPRKNLLEKVCYAAYVASVNKQDSAVIECNMLELRNMKSYFYSSYKAYCNQCEEPFFPRCVCGESSLATSKNGRLLCTDCGKEINEIACEEGHVQHVSSLDDVIVVYPSAELMRNISETLKANFDITLSGSMYIKNGQLNLLPEQKGEVVSTNLLPELKGILNLPIGKDEYTIKLDAVQGINEKCRKSTNKNCNSCLLKDDPICMMKLFSSNPTYRPSPHQAGEFGDISFTVTLRGIPCELVGIAKSAVKEKGAYKDSLILSEPAAREMIQQVLSATHDARIGIIAAICPMRFHDQLTEELRYIAKLTGKPIVIFDDMFMVRQYKAYENRKTMAVS